MEKVILIGGEAGQGIAKSAEIIGKAFVRLGYYAFNYRDYPSLIKGGHNFNVVRISDKPIYSHENEYDVIIALNKETVEKHGRNLKKDGVIICDKSLDIKGSVSIDINSILQKFKAPKMVSNSILIGALFKLFDLPISHLFRTFDVEFGENAEINKRVAEEAYNSVELKKEKLKVGKKERYFLTGNEAISLGALASGIDLYIAYPMTPSTPVLHFLASKSKEHDITVLQLENEIAVINAALGASYAGAMAMVGTSGGGFALMSEAMSLQGMSEVPLVVYLGQRPAPSTGIPTYTSQGDLKFALNVGHGEFPRVVVAPGDSKEAFYRTIEAFYLSYKYRVLSIILGDKHLGESHFTFDSFEEPLVMPSRFLVEPDENYKSYEITKSGVSPRAVPGKVIVRANSYEHDEFGHTTEDPEEITKMNDKRLRKMVGIEREVKKLKPISTYGKGKNLIVAWGSTKGAILDSLPFLKDFKFLQISYLSPFPSRDVKRILEDAKKVVLVENNATGLLSEVIAEKTGYLIEEKILKYDGRPFTPSYLIKRLRRI